jgi:hypothetical protein
LGRRRRQLRGRRGSATIVHREPPPRAP